MSIKKTEAVRISAESKEILAKIYEMTTIPRGTIMNDAIKCFDEKLQALDYNYSKILRERLNK